MKLIVGLGNPGRQYAGTRHNMGFRVIDSFADMASVSLDRSGFNGVYGICKDPRFPEPFILAKPETYMNLSGEFVRQIVNYYKIDLEDIVIIYDDMAIAPGRIRLRANGSSGSHNGMQNIIENLSTPLLKRIRVGIGEPPYSGIEWVLGKPDAEDEKLIEEAIHQATLAVRDYLLHDWQYAMGQYNQGAKKNEQPVS